MSHISVHKVDEKKRRNVEHVNKQAYILLRELRAKYRDDILQSLQDSSLQELLKVKYLNSYGSPKKARDIIASINIKPSHPSYLYSSLFFNDDENATASDRKYVDNDLKSAWETEALKMQDAMKNA